MSIGRKGAVSVLDRNATSSWHSTGKYQIREQRRWMPEMRRLSKPPRLESATSC
jgi:hypothetical protein